VNGLRDPGSVLDRLVLSSRQQLGLRSLVLAAALAVLALLPAAGADFHPWLSAVGTVLAVLAALVPESHVPLALVLYLGALWVVVVPGALGVAALAAGVLLGVLHLACTLASYGPPGLTLDGRLVRVWARRAAACAAAAQLTWLAGRGVASLDRPSAAVAGAAALVLLVAWAALVRRGLFAPDEDAGG
jgi:hypothetical protein